MRFSRGVGRRVGRRSPWLRERIGAVRSIDSEKGWARYMRAERHALEARKVGNFARTLAKALLD